MTLFMRTIRQILKHNRNFSHHLAEYFKKTYNSNRHFYSVATLLHFAVVVGNMEPKKRTRTVSKAKYELTLDSKAQHYLNALKVRWMQLHEIPGLFAYQLPEERPSRKLPGKCGFYVELNADRSLKRRAPQIIDNLNPEFKPKMFNFNKVDGMEVMLTIDEKDSAETQMIINKSPITKFHTLVCPEVKSNLVQRITPAALSFCIKFMNNIDDADMRMGYNSPGALASVNHLHFHLLHMPHNLYIDNVQLQELADDYVYRLHKDSPTEAICFVFGFDDTEQVVQQKLNNVHQLTEWLCNNNLPHNVFITKERKRGDLRLFVFVRSKFCVSKDVTAFNVGFCEMVGYITLSDVEKLEKLTEQQVLERIKDITGTAYESVYQQVKNIVNGTEALWQQPFML